MKKWIIAGTASIALVAIAVGAAVAQHGWGGRHDYRHGYHGHHGEYGKPGHRRWREGRRWRRKHGLRRLRAELLFDELDANKDGKLTKEEISKAKETRFALMDANKDGFVDADEILAYRMKRRAKMMVLRFDKNGDGKLSPDEMPSRGRRLSRFERFDLDENDVVTKTEMRRALRGRGWRRSRREAPAGDR